MAHFVLVPGTWCGGWAFDPIVPGLVEAGHRADALTLPGLEPGCTETGINLDRHVAAVVDHRGVVRQRPRDPRRS